VAPFLARPMVIGKKHPFEIVSKASGGVYHTMVSDYNSSNDSFSTPEMITSIEGPPGTGVITAWVSQTGTDMIFVRLGQRELTQDLYSAHWDGNSWTDVTALPYVDMNSINVSPCVAEDVGELVYMSTAGPTARISTLWQASVTFSEPTPEPATVIIWSLLGAVGIGVGWWRRRRAA
jgi:hypothetical protein